MALYLNNFILIVLLLLAVYFDLTKNKIPNFLTFPVMIWGLVSHTFVNGFEGLLFSLAGLGLGIALLFIPFALGGMGAGDVKLLGAIGAIGGVNFIILAALYGAVIGGIMSIGYMIYNKRFIPTMKGFGLMLAKPLLYFISIRFRAPQLLQITALTMPAESNDTDNKEENLYIPYGVAIALGTFVALSGFTVL